jgi:5-formyltetrahydrofolate cyclo-ligase
MKLPKSELRKIYTEKRKSMSSTEVEDLSKSIFKQFLEAFDMSKVKNVHIFLPIKQKNEVSTWEFIEYFWDKGISVFVPKMAQNEIKTIQLKPDTPLKENGWGILEPEDDFVEDIKYDIVITPLLYCDNQGNRVGYGKGFYDMFFSKTDHSALKVGVSFFPPAALISDVSEQDVPLDYLVTPTEVLSFISKSIK